MIKIQTDHKYSKNFPRVGLGEFSKFAEKILGTRSTRKAEVLNSITTPSPLLMKLPLIFLFREMGRWNLYPFSQTSVHSAHLSSIHFIR